MGRAGFEPANSERTVLQTVCVDRLHIYPEGVGTYGPQSSHFLGHWSRGVSPPDLYIIT
ncbi:hypothetical protein [Synechococcus phage ME01]